MLNSIIFQGVLVILLFVLWAVTQSTLSSTRTTIVNYWTTISLKHARKKYNVIAFLSKKIFFTTLCSLLQLASLKSRHSFHSNGKFGKPKTSPLSILKWNPPTSLTLSLPCQLALIDFTLSNARRFYSSMGNPLGVKGLIGTVFEWT